MGPHESKWLIFCCNRGLAPNSRHAPASSVLQKVASSESQKEPVNEPYPLMAHERQQKNLVIVQQQCQGCATGQTPVPSQWCFTRLPPVLQHIADTSLSISLLNLDVPFGNPKKIYFTHAVETDTSVLSKGS
ncbi:hypothetical protein J6590_003763 [Homalodisca vitripennis]|nr:hypothetical protein J6590_003763 [Homalodisca vitripennis]